MNVLVIGGGGREHALAWKLAQSAKAKQVFVAPGNGGTARDARLKNVDITDPVALAERYEQAGADEIVYLDISASAEERATLLSLARRLPVVVISGRARGDVQRRFIGIPVCEVYGNHGIEPLHERRAAGKSRLCERASGTGTREERKARGHSVSPCCRVQA
mgnify:CR=1 FL=1